jgi:hypothetical protein
MLAEERRHSPPEAEGLMKFGDILRYPDDQGVGDEILFMYLGPTYDSAGNEYRSTMVVRTTKDDDVWTPGEIVTAGIEELIPYVEPGTKVYVDGKELDVVGVDWASIGTSDHDV